MATIGIALGCANRDGGIIESSYETMSEVQRELNNGNLSEDIVQLASTS